VERAGTLGDRARMVVVVVGVVRVDIDILGLIPIPGVEVVVVVQSLPNFLTGKGCDTGPF
jgi:hypothetical protein